MLTLFTALALSAPPDDAARAAVAVAVARQTAGRPVPTPASLPLKWGGNAPEPLYRDINGRWWPVSRMPGAVVQASRPHVQSPPGYDCSSGTCRPVAVPYSTRFRR